MTLALAGHRLPGPGPEGGPGAQSRPAGPTWEPLLQVSGVWYSISMASSDMKRIGEDGDLRVFIQKIESVAGGSLRFFFHFMCVPVAVSLAGAPP